MLLTHDGDDPMATEGNPGSSKSKLKKDISVSAVRTALQCAYNVLQSRIISNPNDMMGILLFGTEKTKFRSEGGSGGYQHCYLLLDLDVPDAEGIRGLKKLIEDPDEFKKVLAPAKEQVSMANVLFAANQIFTTKAANFQSRRLFIVTDEDDPHGADKALKNSSITRARDLYDLGVRIDPFFISGPGKRGGFDASKFYDDIIYRAPGDEDDDQFITSTTTSGAMRLKEMVSSILSKTTAKRALFTTKLEVGPGLNIGVKGYLLYKRQEKARSHYVYTSAEKAQIVQGVTTKIAADTAKVVEKTEIRKAYKFGGEQVVFTPEEMKVMRNFGEPSIRILGFKASSALQFDNNVKPTNFIYPDETTFIGSTRTFAALHKKLVDSDRISICWCITRRSASPQVCAMLPSIEVIEDGVQVHPPGFFLVSLPFADDVRQNPELPLVKAPTSLIDKMRAVVKQLHMPKGYTPEKYSNPALQWHYRILQAIALDEDLPDKVVDTTLPKYKLIDKHSGSQVREWFEELEHVSTSLGVAAPAKAGTKRSVMAVRVKRTHYICQTFSSFLLSIGEFSNRKLQRQDSGEGSSKRAKSVKSEGGDEVESAWKSGTLNKVCLILFSLSR